MYVTFFFSAKKKVTKEKTRDLVTRYNGYALAVPVLSARCAMSQFSVTLDSSLQFFLVIYIPVIKKASGESGQNKGGLLGDWGIVNTCQKEKALTERYLTYAAFAKSGKHRHCQRRGFKAFCGSRDFSLVTFF